MAANKGQRFVDALYALENGGDVEPLAALHGDGADISNPLVPHMHQGPQGARDFCTAYRRSFDTVHSEFQHVEDAADTSFLE